MSQEIGLFTEDICPNCGTDLVRDEEGLFRLCPCRPKVFNRVVGAGRPKPRPPAVDQPLAESNAPLNLTNIYDAGHVPYASQTQADFYGVAYMSHLIQNPGNVPLAPTGGGPPQMPTSSYSEAYMINQSRTPANIYGGIYMANQLRAPATHHDDGDAHNIPRTATNIHEDSLRAIIAPIPTNTHDSAHEADQPPIYNDPRGAIPRTPRSAHEHSHHTSEYKDGGTSHEVSGNTYEGRSWSVPSPINDPRAIRPVSYQGQGASQPSNYKHHEQQGNATRNTQPHTKPNFLPVMKPEESMALNGFIAVIEFGLYTPTSGAPPVIMSDPILDPPVCVINAQTGYAYLIPMRLVKNIVWYPGQVLINYDNINQLFYVNFMNPLPVYQNNVGLAPNYGYNTPIINYQHYANNDGNDAYFPGVNQNLGNRIGEPLFPNGAPVMGFGNQVDLPEEEGACGGVPQHQLGPLPEYPQPSDEVRITSRTQRKPKQYVRKQQITENMQVPMRAILLGDLPVPLCPQAPDLHRHYGSPHRYNGLL